MKTIGFIGLGKMASAIIAGLNKTNYRIIASGRDRDKTEKQARTLGITAAPTNIAVLADSEACDTVILAVKPQVLPAVLKEISPRLTAKHTLVSLAAGFDLTALAELTSPHQACIRVMPNINARIGASTTALAKNGFVTEAAYALTKDIFGQIGSVYEISEKHFSVFAALAGSAPAYIYLFIDSLARAGVLHGLSKDEATQIAAETVAASAQMILKSNEHPQALIDQVTSPGGTTISGLVSLEKSAFSAAVIEAISATIDKEKSLK